MRGMTSYACVQRKGKNYFFEIVIRSGNSRYLEIYTHQLPLAYLFLEDKIKKEVKQKISRGRIEIYFFIEAKPSGKISLNEDFFEQYFRLCKKLEKKYGIAQEVLFQNFSSLPGMVYVQQKNSLAASDLLSAVKEGIAKLIKFKEKEGQLIKKEMLNCLSNINKLVNKIDLARKKIIIDEFNKDISEEMSLLKFYTRKLHNFLINDPRALKGKSIDFLAQEILRELNSASSKTKEKNISWWLVETKTFLERIREQAQNIE